MKKMFIYGSVLCMALLLLCGTALAADTQIQVTPANPDAVQVTQIAKGQDVAFHVTKSSGVEQNQLYLIMIQEGANAADKPKPTKDNLYYLNVEAATGTSLSLEAYPKELKDGGSYIVYLSDYSDGSNGAASGVATITLKGDNGDSGGGETPGTILYGDVNGDEIVDEVDVMVLARYRAGWDGYGSGLRNNIVMKNADVNLDDVVDEVDVMILARYRAGWDGYTLPYTR